MKKEWKKTGYFRVRLNILWFSIQYYARVKYVSVPRKFWPTAKRRNFLGSIAFWFCFYLESVKSCWPYQILYALTIASLTIEFCELKNNRRKLHIEPLNFYLFDCLFVVVTLLLINKFKENIIYLGIIYLNSFSFPFCIIQNPYTIVNLCVCVFLVL